MNKKGNKAFQKVLAEWRTGFPGLTSLVVTDAVERLWLATGAGEHTQKSGLLQFLKGISSVALGIRKQLINAWEIEDENEK